MTVLKPRTTTTALPLRPRAFDETLAGVPDTAPVVASARAWAKSYRARLRITDSVIIIAAIVIAFVCRFGFSDATVAVGTTSDTPDVSASYIGLSIGIAIAWLIALDINRTRDTRVVGVGVAEYKRVVNASAMTFGLLAIAFLVAKVDIARGYFILALPLGLGGIVVSRWAWRKWLIRQRTYGHYLSRALVVGGLEDVEYVVGQIQEKSGAAYEVVGAAVDDSALTRIVGSSGDVPIVSALTHIGEAAGRMGVDTVIVAGQPKGGSQFIRSLGWELEGTATDLVLASRLTDVAGPRIHFRPVEGLPLIHVEIPQFEGGKHVLKRAFDVFASGLALLILAPLMAIIAILIRHDSDGGAFFRQERVGKGGKTFMMFKFRSMVQDAEAELEKLKKQSDGNGVLFKMKNDPRVTRIGAFLRKLSLDELPQLWNVFLGDMSLVGPRPPLQTEVAGYESHVHRRLYIKPGLTGMWQVNGRSDLSWDESVRLDLYYVENWSLTGDLVIMWRTVRVMLNPVGAY